MSPLRFLILGVVLSAIGLGFMFGPAAAFAFSGIVLTAYALLLTLMGVK